MGEIIEAASVTGLWLRSDLDSSTHSRSRTAGAVVQGNITALPRDRLKGRRE